MIRLKLSEEEKYRQNRMLIESVETEGISLEGSFENDLDVKTRLLREHGYNVLYVEGGEAMPLEECSAARITHALRKTYENAKKQVEKFESRIRNSQDYRNLVSLIKAEGSSSDKVGVDARERTAIVMSDASEDVLAVLSRYYGKKVMGGFYRE